MKPTITARLACGCRVTFREGDSVRPVTVFLDRKAETCTIAIHVAGMFLHDHRAAARPSTRFVPALQPDYEDG